MAGTIIGIKVSDRISKTNDLQKVFTEFGCNIKTRLGLHEVSGNHCSTDGIILLELIGDAKELAAFEKKLASIKGLIVKKMVFD